MSAGTSFLQGTDSQERVQGLQDFGFRGGNREIKTERKRERERERERERGSEPKPAVL